MLHITRRRVGSGTRSRSAIRRRLAGLVVAGMALCVPLPAHSQVLYGTLTGNVTDGTGAVTVGASVQAMNVGTMVAKNTSTNARGVYVFNDLQPGFYSVTIEASGFKTLVQTDVIIAANAVRRLDGRLEVSGISETVEVTATSAPLQTERADLHVTQTSRQVNELPLTGSTGRNYQGLMQIVPGATLAGEQNSAAGSPQRSISFNVNGVSRLQNNTKLDGASIVYPWLPTNTAYVPAAEAISEVSVVTNSYNAEIGMAGGAAVNVIIKSGTNDLHAAGWGYGMSNDLKARNYFQTGAPGNPHDVLAQYGANAGGPVMKNKVFFFGNWERTTRRNASPTRLYSLAPADIRAGNFSATGVTIYDPASSSDPALRTPFPNNTIPANRIDPGAAWLLARMPLPTTPGYVNNYTAQGTGSFTRDNIDIKGNYQASGKLSAFGRYSISPSNIFDPPALGEAGGDALNGGQGGNAPGRTQIGGGGITYMFGPTLLLDANIGFTHQVLGAENVDIDHNYGLEELGIPGTNGPDRMQSGIPSFQITGWANLGNPNTGNPFQFRDNQYVTSLNLTWVKDAHSYRFGFDYQNQQLNHFQPQGGTFQTARGTFQFNGNITRLQNGPTPADTRYNSWADFLLGLPSGAGKVEQLRNPNSLRMDAYSAYAQDQWQFRNNLTINYGLRWEIYPFPARDVGGVSRFDPADGKVYTGGNESVPVNTGASSGHGLFLPRLGATYRLNDKTVLRAGYGHSADPKPFIDFRNAYPINFAWSHPTATYNGVTNAFIPVTTLRLGLNQALYGVAPDLTKGIIPLPTGTGTTTYPKEAQRKYIQSWNLAFQRELFPNVTAQVAYVGTRAVGQQQFININASAPGTGNAGRPLSVFGIVSDINMIEPFKTTTYNALQADVRARLSQGQFGLVYTLAEAVNYADNDANPRIQWMPDAELNKAVAGYDRTHNLQGYWVWDLPFGSRERWAKEGAAAAVLGGWQINGLMSIMSGTSINIVQGSANNLNAAGSGQYPDKAKDTVEIKGGVGSGNEYFDRTAFVQVNIPSGQTQRFGNSGRNPIRGPGFFNLDLGVFRTISLKGQVKFQIRAEALNVLNHTNFANPGGDISNAGTFGFITSTVNSLGATGTGERNFRIGARISF